MAVINACCNTPERLSALSAMVSCETLCTDGMDLRGLTVGMIGRMRRTAEGLKAAKKVYIFELSPKEGDLPASEEDRLLLATIADQIANRETPARLVLIAGPSSSGKTTFTKRLMTHLRVNGMRPFMLSTDDYFVGDDENPRDEHGNLDYEHLHAVDLPRLNRDLAALLACHPVHLPRFNFKTKSREESPAPVLLAPDHVILIEGIHALNPELTAEIPREMKFLIYISALTQLAIDHNSRISTTDNRLLRRMVRDDQFRHHRALQTLRRWPSVRRGEERWIFPFQHLADAVFNSSLDYELAVIKPFATTLLNEIKPTEPEYAEARRLSGILHNFVAMTPQQVPGDSILREYIGGSLLTY